MPPRAPRFVCVPTPIAYASEVDDALLVTMTRILGLCWNRQETPPMPPGDLADALGRSRSALYRHLRQLGEGGAEDGKPSGLGWVRVSQQGRLISVRPLVRVRPLVGDVRQAPPESSPAPQRAQAGGGKAALVEALSAAGIGQPKLGQLLRLNIDPAWVRAWHRYVQDPARANLTNPAGLIVCRLEQRERPPDRYLRMASAPAVESTAADNSPGELPPSLAPRPEPDEPEEVRQARALWDEVLTVLQWNMERAAYDHHPAHTRLRAVDGDTLIIAARPDSVRWLNQRLMRVIQRAIRSCTGRDIRVRFVAR